MSAKKIPITPIFKDLPTVAQVVAMSTATIERLEREGQFPKRRQLSGQRVGWLVREVQEWAESRPVSQLPPPPNTGVPSQSPSSPAALSVSPPTRAVESIMSAMCSGLTLNILSISELQPSLPLRTS